MALHLSPGSKIKTATSHSPALLGGWIVLILILPRILRLLYPQVWVEDDFYLEGAFLVSAGMKPYTDFIHPHMPVLEFFTAGYLKLFGASHFSIEVLNETAIFATSAMVVLVAGQIAGRTTAILSALLYAFSSLVFRYHVYERECFAGAVTVGAVLCALDDQLTPSRQASRIAELMLAAITIKLTSIIPAAIVLGYLGFGKKRWGTATAAAAAIAAGLAGLIALFYWLYGSEFLFQIFIFHFMKGRDFLGHLAVYPAQILDVIAPLFLLGLLRMALARRIPAGMGLILALVAGGYLFFGLLSPTAWGHNYLDLLPFIAIVAGYGLERMVLALVELVSGAETGGRGAEWGWLAGGVVFSLLMLLTAAPLANENWLHDSTWGFGFVPRDEIRQVASALRDITAPSDPVIAPAFICFEANRRELIAYPETYGVWREAKNGYRRDGFFKTRERMGNEDFFRLIGNTSHWWSDQMLEAVRAGRVRAIIADSPIQLLPIVSPPIPVVDETFLLEHDFRPELRTEHYVLWKHAAVSPSQRLAGLR